VKLWLAPEQIVAVPGDTLTLGNAITDTVLTALPVQPLTLVLLTVYEVVTDGVAITDDPLVVLSPVPGDQV